MLFNSNKDLAEFSFKETRRILFLFFVQSLHSDLLPTILVFATTVSAWVGGENPLLKKKKKRKHFPFSMLHTKLLPILVSAIVIKRLSGGNPLYKNTFSTEHVTQ